jgi:hypothetical protein
MPAMTITLPAETLDAIVRQVADLVLAQSAPQTPWMTRREAAEYLRLPISRLEKHKGIPAHRDEGRVMYHRDELDKYFLGFGR